MAPHRSVRSAVIKERRCSPSNHRTTVARIVILGNVRRTARDHRTYRIQYRDRERTRNKVSALVRCSVGHHRRTQRKRRAARNITRQRYNRTVVRSYCRRPRYRSSIRRRIRIRRNVRWTRNRRINIINNRDHLSRSRRIASTVRYRPRNRRIS